MRSVDQDAVAAGCPGEGVGDKDRPDGGIVVYEVLAREGGERLLDVYLEPGGRVGKRVGSRRPPRRERGQDPVVQVALARRERFEACARAALSGYRGKRRLGIARPVHAASAWSIVC